MIIDTKYDIGNFVLIKDFKCTKWKIGGIKKDAGCDIMYSLFYINTEGECKSIWCCEDEIELYKEDEIGFKVNL